MKQTDNTSGQGGTGDGKVPVNIKDGWGRITQRLRAEIGDDLYTSWFGRMEPDSLGDTQLTVSVPTRFLKSWIENHYMSKLRKIAAAEFTAITTIQVKVRSQGQPVARHQAPKVQMPAVRGSSARATGDTLQPIAALAPVIAGHAPDGGAQADEALTFETFKVGQSNQLAHAAAMRVAMSQPGHPVSFNPLFIHAGAGFGKTHLLSSVAQRVRNAQPLRKVMMLTAERFMYSFIHAVRQKDTLAFKDQFQSIDVLLIDDFQFLQGRAIQQEFCHSFNSLVDQRRQVVVAADVPPSQLDTIDQRMRSRLMGGLVVDIEAPDQALRRQILQARYDLMRARDPNLALPDEILDLVAERVTGSGRELEGALNKLFAHQQFQHQSVSLELAGMLLRDTSFASGADQGRIKIEDILKVVGRHFNVAKADLLSPRRARTVVLPRQIGMYLAKKLTSRSLPEIGRRFGGRDHSTVLHAVRKIEDQIKGDDKLAKDVATLIRLIEQGMP
ncbi:MAG: chromosomal replication initiator protein DnaA [Proteobacteria bacterium]|nr:chromosomal replication initiator protein DnaA [Pseudomonadota bacterium]